MSDATSAKKARSHLRPPTDLLEPTLGYAASRESSVIRATAAVVIVEQPAMCSRAATPGNGGSRRGYVSLWGEAFSR